MGGSSSTAYPTQTLGGLWSGANTSYAPLANSTMGVNALAGNYNQIGSLTPTANFSGASQQALNTGFDPQHALYNKMFQQQQDQNNAALSQSGVGTTPYGAGLMQQGNQNFDIAWQQAQLANQAQGVNTAEAAQNAALQPTQQQIQDYLANAAQNLTGLNSQWGTLLNSLSGTNNLYGTQGTLNNQANQQMGQSLGGLGSLLGSTVGAGYQGYGPLSFLGPAAAGA